MAGSLDSVRHDLLLAKVARRVNDRDILHLVKLMLKASGKRRSTHCLTMANGRCEVKARFFSSTRTGSSACVPRSPRVASGA